MVESDTAMSRGADAGATTTDQENAEPREKRTRDRYGRDRARGGERNGRGNRGDDRQAEQEQTAQPALDGFAAPAPAAEIAAPALTAADTVAAATPAPMASAPVAPATSTATATATAAATPSAGLPLVQPFALPVDTLAQMAQASGLSWVNSDEEKIKVAQAAIAAQPDPIHVPREIPVRDVVDEGPLVLVETKRDLRNLNLPFEQSSTS